MLLMCTKSTARGHGAAEGMEAWLGAAVAELGLGQARAVLTHVVITLQ